MIKIYKNLSHTRVITDQSAKSIKLFKRRTIYFATCVHEQKDIQKAFYRKVQARKELVENRKERLIRQEIELARKFA